MSSVTAGWAAPFIAAIAAYFQVRAARSADRRLVLAGLPVRRLAAARAVTGLALAVLASAAAVVTLAARTGIDHPGRVLAGTFMFAVIYLAFGALIGTPCAPATRASGQRSEPAVTAGGARRVGTCPMATTPVLGEVAAAARMP